MYQTDVDRVSMATTLFRGSMFTPYLQVNLVTCLPCATKSNYAWRYTRLIHTCCGLWC